MDWWVDLLLEDADLRDGHTSNGTHEEAKKRKEVCMEKPKRHAREERLLAVFSFVFSLPSLSSQLFLIRTQTMMGSEQAN